MKLGANAAIDYTSPEWAAEVLAATGGRGVEVILDPVGGPIGEQRLSCLAEHGRLVVYGVSGTRLAQIAGSQLMHGNQSETGYRLTDRLHPRDGTDSPAAASSASFWRSPATAVHAAYPLEQAADAHRAISSRRAVGKVVLTM